MIRSPRSGIQLALLLLVATCVAACGVPGTISSSGRLPAVGAAPTPAPLPPVTFPQDEAPHHDLTEWWYYTGHLHGTDSAGRAHVYGFELTFFQTLRGQFPPYYAAHFAVTDVTRGHFNYDDQAASEPPTVIPASGSRSGFDLRLGGWTMRGLGGHDHLDAGMAGYAIDLDLTGVTPPALHGGSGIITYGPAGFSYYYSRPRMLAGGTLSDHGSPVRVSGQAWMDHQWGNFVSLAGAGWDWYSIQLDDNTEYMLYVLRDAQKRPLTVFGTYVSPDGTGHALAASDIHAQALSTWTSPHTGGTYPSGWRVTITSQTLSIALIPLVRDQELVTSHSTGVAYWEGDVAISGSRASKPVRGEGYVELTGYASLPPGSAGSSFP